MKIAFESPDLMLSVAHDLSILTDCARICINDIHYDPEAGIVSILMKRVEITGFRMSILRAVRPVYGKTKIDTLLTIKQVVDFSLQVDELLVSKCNSCFMVEAGLTIIGNNIYLSSVEEASGKVLCRVIVTVKDINIEFVDKP